jgi:hypothetical protein
VVTQTASPPGVDGSAPPPPPPPPSARQGGRLVWGAALILLGVVWALSIAGVVVPWGLLVPVGLVALGVLLLVVRDRSLADALVGFGVVFLVLALLAPGVRTVSGVAVGERSEEPTVVTDLETSYQLAAGSLTLDLRELDIASSVDGGDAVLVANVALGELVVLLPPGIEVTGRAAAGMGEVVVLDREHSGVGPRVVLPEATGDAPVLELDLQVGLGSIEVSEEARS